MYRILTRCSHGRVPIKRLSILAIVLLLAVWLSVTKLTASPYGIYVNGSLVATVNSLGTARRVLSESQNRCESTPFAQTRFVERVELRRTPGKTRLLTVLEAKQALEEVTSVEAHAYAILADGEPIVALSGRSDALQALDAVKKHYEMVIGGEDPESHFKERISVEERYVPVQLFQPSADAAAGYLSSNISQPMIHIVKAGDRCSKIALRYHTTLDALKRLNHGLDLDRLSKGDQIYIRSAKLPITVITKTLVDKTVSVAPPAEMRRYSRMGNGTRRTRVILTYENGREVDEQVMSQITTWDRSRVRRSYDDDGGYRHYRRHRRHRHDTPHDKDAPKDLKTKETPPGIDQ